MQKSKKTCGEKYPELHGTSAITWQHKKSDANCVADGFTSASPSGGVEESE